MGKDDVMLSGFLAEPCVFVLAAKISEPRNGGETVLFELGTYEWRQAKELVR